MTSINEMRSSGIGVVGDRPWGTHFCSFYESKRDLLAMLVSYFKAGLENNEFCVWVVSEPLSERDAWDGLRNAVPEFEDYVSKRSIEVFDGREWYLKGGVFDATRVIAAWNEKVDRALDCGHVGLRGSGNAAWLQKKDWKAFSEYEQVVNESVVGRPTFLLCTYPLESCGATELLDVVHTHQFAKAMRRGEWELIETPELKQTKAEIKKMNEELELRVSQRTHELETANQKLTQAQTALARISRVTSLGALSAHIAHEVNQPLGAVIFNAQACLGWIDHEHPNLMEARAALERIVRDGTRAGEVVQRVRTLAKNADTKMVPLNLNEVLSETLSFVQHELQSSQVALRAEHASALPVILADKVQLQQVILNLVINGIEAMQAITDRRRELLIRSEQDDAQQVRVTVTDCGVGFSADSKGQLFNAFFTTKSTGMGMGLSICRSIIELHGGRIWAVPNVPHGATVQFTLPLHPPVCRTH
jgi:signal transduction histidine kinase